MAESSWPFENQDSTEAQFSTLFRQSMDTGVVDDTLKAYADSSGMFVKVPAGAAVVQGFYYRNDSLLTLSVPASSASARVDSVVLKLDPAANRAYLALKTGTSSAPALTQTDTDVYELRVADVAVPASATTVAAGNVTDRRRFTSVPWGRWSTADRPTAPSFGKPGYNTTTKRPEYWDGANWQDFSKTTTDASQLTSGTLASARLDYGVFAAARGDRTVDAPVDAFGQLNGDWNQVLQPGAYRVWAGNTNANAPGGAYLYGTLVVFGAGASVQSRTQVYLEHGNNGNTWTRTAWNGNDWNPWRFHATDLDIANMRAEWQGLVTQEANARTGDVGALNTRASGLEASRVVNRGAAGALQSGNALMTGFVKDTNTGNYVASANIAYSFTAAPNVVVTPWSTDSGGVTVGLSEVNATYCKVTLTRRNAVNTGFSWMAAGNG